MKTDLFGPARLAVAHVSLLVASAPLHAVAQSGLASSEAEAFMGDWTGTLQTEFGAVGLDLRIADQDGRVSVVVGAPSMGITERVTNVTRSGDRLVLTYEADTQGQVMSVEVTLERDGEDLAFDITAAGGQFTMSGTAVRAGPRL